MPEGHDAERCRCMVCRAIRERKNGPDCVRCGKKISSMRDGVRVFGGGMAHRWCSGKDWRAAT